jgi:2,3-bisphosphoglycerate-independent phosphoglycerate mutase
MFVILDGWGWREDSTDNAVRMANTPVLSRLWAECPHAFLKTSGRDVGLPDGQMGNSEVGHLNIGAGRVVMQDLPRIDTAIEDGSLTNNKELGHLIEATKASGGTCHLLGLVSPGGVHAHQDHAVALARILTRAGVPAVLHAFTDGRDTPPTAAAAYLKKLRSALADSVPIVTVSGRYYAMDRDNRWDRVQKAYLAVAEGEGWDYPDWGSAIDDAHRRNVTDEFIVPASIGRYRGIKDGDSLLCFNFRADRVREILAALVDPSFNGFERKRVIKFAAAAGMTRYSTALEPYLLTLFPPQPMTNLLGGVVAAQGMKQLRMAETEKYPHVTYFFNGGEEAPNPGEDRIMEPSPKVATYDLQPEMSAVPLTDKAIEAIGSGRYDLIILNFANPDMVGHTGRLGAAIKAVETVDSCLGRIVEAIGKAGGVLLTTADHGNCELMRDPVTGGPHTAHTTNPVPVVLVGAPAGTTLHDGRLADIAPSLLQLMGLAPPSEMTGSSLLDGHEADTGR